MTGYLIMKYILFAFVAYFVYLVLASMIKNHRKKKERKFSKKVNESSFYQTNSKKEIPVYIGGDYTPIQLNKKHPSYQENLDKERKLAEKRREEREEQNRRRRDNDFNTDYDDSVFETTRRTSSTPIYAHETSSHHNSHGGDSGGHSSDSGSSSSGGDGGGGGGGGD